MLIHRKGVLLDGIGSELVRVGSLIKTIRRWLELLVMGYVNVKAYGAKGDLLTFSTGAITASDQTLTVTGASFTNNDIGKKIWVQYAAGGSLPLVTTIASINSSTSVELTDAANSGVGSLTNLEIAYGTDDTTAIKAALASIPARGGEIFFPVGSYGWSDGNGIVLGDGSASAPSTIQNIDLIGEVGGTGKLLTAQNVQGVEIRWFGSGTGTYMLDAKGPVRISIEHITFDAKYRVNTIWNLKHVFYSFFHACNVQNARQVGIAQGAYPTASGVATGSSNNHFDHVRVDCQGQVGAVAWRVGDTTFTSGYDVSRNTYANCTMLVSDDSGMTWPTATANTSTAIQLSFADNCSFIDCFTFVAGQRRGFGVRVVPPTGTGGGPYPTEIAFYNCPLIGGVTVDGSGQTWTPDTNYGRGLSFHGLNTGDMTDPAYSGHASIPTSTSNGSHEGFNGVTGDGVVLDRFQQQLTRSGISSYSVSSIGRDHVFQSIASSTTETDIFNYTLKAGSLYVFDRIANATKHDRQIDIKVRGSYKNSSGSSDNFAIKVYLGSQTVYDSGLIAMASNASTRAIRLDVCIRARSSNPFQYADGILWVGAPGSGGDAIASISTALPYLVETTGLTVDPTIDNTLRVTIQHATSDANIVYNDDTTIALMS